MRPNSSSSSNSALDNSPLIAGEQLVRLPPSGMTGSQSSIFSGGSWLSRFTCETTAPFTCNLVSCPVYVQPCILLRLHSASCSESRIHCVCVCVRAKSVLYVHVLSVRARIVCARAWVRMLGTGERPGTCEPSVCCMCMLCEPVHTFGSRTKLWSLARESLASEFFGVE